MKIIRSIFFVAIGTYIANAVAYTRIMGDGQESAESQEEETTPAIAATQASEERDNKELTCLEKKAIEKNNKDIIKSSIQEIFGDHDISAIDKYYEPDFIHHNPNQQDGTNALKLTVAEWIKQTEKSKIDFRKISAEGDLVWVQLKNHSPVGMESAVIDIYKLENGKIVEHWDIIQLIPDLKDSKNPHPFF